MLSKEKMGRGHDSVENGLSTGSRSTSRTKFSAGTPCGESRNFTSSQARDMFVRLHVKTCHECGFRNNDVQIEIIPGPCKTFNIGSKDGIVGSKDWKKEHEENLFTHQD